MKQYLIVTILLISAVGFSQKYVDTLYNFKVDKGNIIWQKVINYQNDSLKKLFKEKILSKTESVDLKETQSIISFSTQGDVINIKKYGGSALFSSFYIQEANNYFTSIEFKDNKYRITIKNFTSSATNNNLKLRLERYIVRKKKIKNTKVNNKSLKIYDDYFIEKFTITNKTNDW
jgi:hypothetical protein